jgi:hypothetical protein
MWAGTPACSQPAGDRGECRPTDDAGPACLPTRRSNASTPDPASGWMRLGPMASWRTTHSGARVHRCGFDTTAPARRTTAPEFGDARAWRFDAVAAYVWWPSLAADLVGHADAVALGADPRVPRRRDSLACGVGKHCLVEVVDGRQGLRARAAPWAGGVSCHRVVTIGTRTANASFSDMHGVDLEDAGRCETPGDQRGVESNHCVRGHCAKEFVAGRCVRLARRGSDLSYDPRPLRP